MWPKVKAKARARAQQVALDGLNSEPPDAIAIPRARRLSRVNIPAPSPSGPALGSGHNRRASSRSVHLFVRLALIIQFGPSQLRSAARASRGRPPVTERPSGRLNRIPRELSELGPLTWACQPAGWPASLISIAGQRHNSQLRP